jgi:methionyl-tRNA formyltransferase
MNIIFAGTPALGLPCLEALFSSRHQLIAVYTQPDRPAGRGRQLLASPVKKWATEHQIPVYQPSHFKQPETINELAALKPDIIIVIAYGLILPRTVLDIPRFGCINVHVSLLPRWRGASPIQQAILNNDLETGITIMQMDEGLDTGPMLTNVSCPIEKATAGELHDRLATLAVPPLLKALDDLESGQATFKPQDNRLATYAPKINKEEAVINWHQSAKQIDCQIRAFSPWPIAQTLANGVTLRVHQAAIVAKDHSSLPGTILAIDKQGIVVACGEDAIIIQRLQFPGGKAMAVAEWLNAHRHQLQVNLVLG